MLQCIRLKKREKIQVIARHAQAEGLQHANKLAENVDEAEDSSHDSEFSDDDMDEVISFTLYSNLNNF